MITLKEQLNSKSKMYFNGNKGILVDRDGVLIKNRPDYIKKIEEVIFIDRVEESVVKLWNYGYSIYVVTNQAGVAKGLYTIDIVISIHKYIENHFLKYGKGIIKWYFCPHRDEDHCNCRKPKTGLLMKAISENELDPFQTWMVGDKKSDIEAGYKAGCKTALVETGWGKDQSFANNIRPNLTSSDFPSFVDHFLQTV